MNILVALQRCARQLNLHVVGIIHINFHSSLHDCYSIGSLWDLQSHLGLVKYEFIHSVSMPRAPWVDDSTRTDNDHRLLAVVDDCECVRSRWKEKVRQAKKERSEAGKHVPTRNYHMKRRDLFNTLRQTGIHSQIQTETIEKQRQT